MTIKEVCENTNNKVIIKDNGNGSVLFTGHSHEATKMEFSMRECRGITASGVGIVELYARHEDE